MHIATVIGLAAAIVFASPSVVWAQQGFIDTFKTLCYDNPGNPENALAAAEKMGWAPLPSQMFQDEEFALANARGRMKSTEQEMQFLIVGVVPERELGAPLAAQGCMLMSTSAIPNFGEQFRVWVGVDPVQQPDQPDSTLYTIEVQADGSRAARGGLTFDEAQKAMRDGKVHLMMGGAEDGITVTAYMAPSPPK